VGKVQVAPQLDIFNALNVAPVVGEVQTFGTALGRPLRVLDPRLLRVGIRVNY
jgi:hypothetical protein